MLAVLGVIPVLWVGTAVVMAEVHKNVRPVFIVLSSVITVGLAYAWYSFNHSDTSDNSDVKEREEREEREDAESGTPLLWVDLCRAMTDLHMPILHLRM